MNQLEKDQKLAALRTREEMLEDEIRATKAEIEDVKRLPVKQEFKVWEPEAGEKYWYTPFGCEYTHGNGPGENRIIGVGLCHPTKEAVERHHEFLKMLHDLNKFAVEHNEGWKPDWSEEYLVENNKSYIAMCCKNTGGRLIVKKDEFKQNTILPFFKTGQLAAKAIDTFGDRLKILFEYYNS